MILFINLLIRCMVIVCVQSAFAGQLELDYMSRMAQSMDYAEQQQAAVWPGFHPAMTPSVMLYRDHTNQLSAYAINFKPVLLPWQKLRLSGKDIYFLQDASTLMLGNSSDNTFVQLEGQNVFLDMESEDYLKYSENYYNKFLTTRADYYLRHQSKIDPIHFYDLDIPYSSFNKLELIKLIYLEDAALTLALQTNADQAEEALQDAVAIRQYRMRVTEPSALAYENGSEIVYGIPFFIGLASQHLNDEQYRKMSQHGGCKPLSTLWGLSEFAKCAERYFPAYATSVYGQALDKKKLDVTWKAAAETQFKSVPRMAVDYYKMSDSDARIKAEMAMNKPQYHYDRITHIFDFLMPAYLKKMTIAVQAYQQLNGIEFYAPVEWGFILSSAPSTDNDSYMDEYIVDNQTALYSTVNASSKVMNEILQFSQLPFVYHKLVTNKSIEDRRNSATIFKIDSDAVITIDGVSVSAADFINAKNKRHYQTLVMTDSHINIQVQFPGVLDASTGKLKLTYDKVFRRQEETSFQDALEH